jgi:hypothetical protein
MVRHETAGDEMASDETVSGMASDEMALGRGTTPDARAGSLRRRVPVQAALVAVAALLVVGAGVAVWPNRSDSFCDRVAELPPITQLGSDGTPAEGLRASASAYGRLADAAGDEAVAAAARTFAAHQHSLADAVAGASSSGEVVEQVQALDQDDLARATATLDDEIARRCS